MMQSCNIKCQFVMARSTLNLLRAVMCSAKKWKSSRRASSLAPNNKATLTRTVPSSSLPNASENEILFLVSTVDSEQLEKDPYAFPGEREMSQSRCFKEELEILNNHEPQPYPTSKELRVVRAVRVQRVANEIAELCIQGIVYLEDARSAMRRFQESNLYSHDNAKEYDGLFLSGLCRFAATKGIGKQLLWECIRYAMHRRQNLYLSIFNMDDQGIQNDKTCADIRFSHQKLVSYYRQHGFTEESECTFRGQLPIKYTIMVFTV